MLYRLLSLWLKSYSVTLKWDKVLEQYFPVVVYYAVHGDLIFASVNEILRGVTLKLVNISFGVLSITLYKMGVNCLTSVDEILKLPNDTCFQF